MAPSVKPSNSLRRPSTVISRPSNFFSRAPIPSFCDVSSLPIASFCDFSRLDTFVFTYLMSGRPATTAAMKRPKRVTDVNRRLQRCRAPHQAVLVHLARVCVQDSEHVSLGTGSGVGTGTSAGAGSGVGEVRVCELDSGVQDNLARAELVLSSQVGAHLIHDQRESRFFPSAGQCSQCRRLHM